MLADSTRTTFVTLTIILLVVCSSATGQDQWINGFGGFYHHPFNWQDTTPPGPNDQVEFGIADDYLVTWTDTTGDTVSREMFVTAGTATFRSTDANRKHRASDLWVAGGLLNLGFGTDPMTIEVADGLNVNSNGTLVLNYFSRLRVEGPVGIGTFGGFGALVVSGVGSRFDCLSTLDANIGQLGHLGRFFVDTNAVATFQGDLNVAVSSSDGTGGEIVLLQSSALDVKGDFNLLTGSGDNQTSQISMYELSNFVAHGDINIGTGTGENQSSYFGMLDQSLLNQVGAGAINLGGINQENSAVIRIDRESTFESGEGQISINASGKIEVIDGLFEANGPVVINPGGELVIDSPNARFEANAGLSNNRGNISLSAGRLLITGGEFEGQLPYINSFLCLMSGSTANVTGLVSVGSSGTGTLQIDNGTQVTTGETVYVGSGATGYLYVSQGSQLATDKLVIGNGNYARMFVSEASIVEARELMIGISPSASPEDGTVFVNPDSTMMISQDVYVAGTSSMASGGRGELRLRGGTTHIGGTLLIWNTGEVLMSATSTFLSADTIDTSEGGLFEMEFGTLEVQSFIGNLLNQQGTLAPGPGAAPTSIVGDYTQQPGSALAIEIGGTIPGGTHDVVTVVGDANIDGQLTISLIDGFSPDSDDEIAVLNSNSIIGFFDNVFTGQRLELASGEGSFVVNYGFGSAYPANQIVLSDFQANSIVVAPDSVVVTRGVHFSGDETDLAASDNTDLSLRRQSSDIQSRTEFEVKGTSSIANPSSFEFTLEGSVFARSNVVQTIELFDYVTGNWEILDTRNAARTPNPDSVVTVSATGDLSRFVGPGTMCIEARVRYKSDNPRQNFASNTDQTSWRIE